MKKVIPVIIAIALILLVSWFSFGQVIIDHFAEGHDVADESQINEHFEIFGSDDVRIFLNDERTEYSGRIIDGGYYFSQDIVEEFFTERFYVDTNEELLLYSTPQTTLESTLGSTAMTDVQTGEVKNYNYPISVYKDDTLYIAVEYLKNIVSFSYETFADPNRMQLYLEDTQSTVATIKSDTPVRRLAGKKALILTELKADDQVTVLGVLDEDPDWTKVKTKDCFIGYVKSNKLKDETVSKITVDKCPYSETFTYLNRDYKINLTWHNMEYPIDGSDLKAALAPTKAVNVVSPTWYWVTDNDGNIASVANANYAKTAHDMGLEVWALISDFHSGVEGLDMNEVLSYTSKRRSFVDRLVTTLVNDGADGVNVDFEKITRECAPHYVQFIRELTLACHANGILVSVDNFVPTEYTAHYNRHSQAEFADYIIIMGYDEHYAGSPEAGSVASVPWMQEGIENTLKYVPKERVINAVPFYTRVWMTEGGDVKSEAVTMATSQDFLTRNGLTATWNEASFQNYAEVSMGGILYQVWMEDADSMEVRLSVMDALGIAGVASWKLGQETGDIWDLIETYMSR